MSPGMKRTPDTGRVAAANAAQASALKPTANVWISANAGTGKTEVLTRRLLSLLIADPACPPRAVLALTFTKAGAAEMAARLPRKLAELAANDDATLAEWVRTGLGLAGTPAECARVRELGPLVAAEPPLIRTIHGFAQELLQRFPDEAGVPQGFSVLEDAEGARLLQEAQGLALELADADVTGAVDTLVGELGEFGWRELTRLTRANWPKLSDLLAHSGGRGPLLAQLRVALGIASGEEPFDGRIVPDAGMIRLLREVVEVSAHAETDAVLAAAAAGDEAGLEEAWLAFHYTKAGTLRAKLVKAEVSKARPDIVARLSEIQADIAALRARQAAWRTLALTQALLVWGDAVQGAFRTLKRNRGALDYQDLLDASEALLLRDEQGFREWVLYKLDRRFRHLLVDEAQDNSPQQARLVALLAREFVQAGGADQENRTVLAVGDVKQSIFRFQGARPEFFLALREMLGGLGHLQEVDMRHSFRSAEAVLAAVDAVFSPEDLAEAVQGEAKAWPGHASVFSGAHGRVELWPLVPRPDTADAAPWTLPMERPVEVRGVTACARMVATRILQDIESSSIIPSTGQPLRPEDVLVLVRTNANRDAMIQGLRAAGLPVSGGALTLEHPALQDLAALLRVLHNPEDHLSLAVFLKGPMGGWGDAQLLELYRLGPDWWGGLDQLDAPLAATLRALRAVADSEPPAALLGRLVQVFGVPSRYGRNAVEVADIQAACDNLALLLEACGSLTDAVARLEDEVAVAGTTGGGIRVMTAHKSKGLEAPVVILPDTTQPLADTSKEKLLWLERGDRLGGVIYRQPSAWATPLQEGAAAAERERQRADSLRLLYVAMTRARDQLWVTGWETRKTATEDCWYGLVQAGLERMETALRLEDGRLVVDAGLRPEAAELAAELAVERPMERATAGQEIPAGAPLAWPVADVVGDDSRTIVQTAAMARGEQLHGWLAATPNGAEPAEAARVRDRFPELFGPGSMAEVEIILPDGRLGRMDRLVVRDGEMWIIDFKSERIVPAEIPSTYLAQLADYQAALTPLANGRRVRAAIVWTVEARLQWLA